ncbi:hypothetical protein JCM3774_002807 [Rhodotorula dairenensis]
MFFAKLFTLATLTLASMVDAAPRPVPRLRAADETGYHALDRRQSNCPAGMTEVERTESAFVCRDTLALWGRAAFEALSLATISGTTIIVVHLVTSRWKGVNSVSVGRRDGASVGDVEIAGANVTVTAASVDNRRVVQVADLFAAAGLPLAARAYDDQAPTIIGGEVAYHNNGTLDTFTIDLQVPAGNSSDSSLVKRGYWTLHTTYWATSGHETTSLGEDRLKPLVQASYLNEGHGASQVCGYMANSGTWHGAFRHWTGDNGYSVGECERLSSFSSSLTVLAGLSGVLAAPAAPAGGKQLDSRGSSCHGGDTAIFRTGSAFVCTGEQAYWRGAAISALSFGTIANVADHLTDWINSRALGGSASYGRRRGISTDVVAANATSVPVQVGGTTLKVPFSREGSRIVIDISAFLAGGVAKRAADAIPSATLVGGTASYFEDGVLDTCTLDFLVSGEAAEAGSDSVDDINTLVKRDQWALHTTYWAEPNHQQTALVWNDIYTVALASYRSLPTGVSQVCGYMANSGTWHGAFRHWTGDYGYTVGECVNDRKF